MKDEKIYIPIIAFFVLLGSTFGLFGIKGLTSSIFMLSVYLMVVPILFFTYGAYIEKQIVKNQVDRLINNIKESADELGYNSIPNIEIPEDKDLDSEVKKENEKLIKNAFTYLSIAFVGGLILTVGLWYLAKRRNNGFNYKHMAIENLGLLLLVVITEIVFFGVITKNYRTLDSNRITRFTIQEIAKKLR